MFLTQFMAGIVRKKLVGSLMSLPQGPEESLKSFLMRFNQERLATEDGAKEFVYCALFQGIKRDGPLMADLVWKPPRHLYEFIERAKEFINQDKTPRAFLGSDSTQALSSEAKKKNNLREELGGTKYPLKNEVRDLGRITCRAPIEEVLSATKISLPCEEPRGIPRVPLAKN
jgi:hypothetical protein